LSGVSLSQEQELGVPHKRKASQMLKCEICTCTTEILAHQVRGEFILAVCLDCADRFYQDQLTKSLIESEKVGA